MTANRNINGLAMIGSVVLILIISGLSWPASGDHNAPAIPERAAAKTIFPEVAPDSENDHEAMPDQEALRAEWQELLQAMQAMEERLENIEKRLGFGTRPPTTTTTVERRLTDIERRLDGIDRQLHLIRQMEQRLRRLEVRP